MHERQRYKLHFGPYRTPKFRYGSKVEDLARGEVKIVKLCAGKIPWPIAGKRCRGDLSPVLYRDLAKAVRRESALAVGHWWGVCPATVRKWRRALGVGRSTEGDHRLRVAISRENFPKCLPGILSKSRDSARREKIAASKRGKKRDAATIAKMAAANRGKRLGADVRRKMSEAHKRRGTRPPAAGVAWSAVEDRLLRKLPPAEVVQRTGRTLTAVYSRRSVMGLAK